MRPSLSQLKPLLLLSGLTALFYSPLLLGLQTFPDGDFTHHFLPFSLFQQSELFSGRLPLWNPYTYSGHPFLADTQAAIFYPINVITLLVASPLEGLFDSTAGGRLYFLQVEALIHVIFAGFFVSLLVHSFTQNRLSGLIAGIIFAFSGYLTSYPPLQLAVLRTAIWLPLILYLLHRAFEEPHRFRWWLGFILTTTSAFMAGHPQTMLHIAYVSAAWIGALLVGQGKLVGHGNEQDQPLVRTLISLALSTLAIVGLSAVQLLPSLEFAQLSVRAETSYDFVSAGFPIRDTWQLIIPGVFTWFSPLYIGTVGLGLAVCAVGLLGGNLTEKNRIPTKLRSITLFWIVITLVALLVSYGRNGFLYPLFYRFAPGWDLFRQQERAAYIVTLGLSVLAGIGYFGLTSMPLKRRRLLIVTYAAVIIGSVYTFGLLWQVEGKSVVSNLLYVGMAAGTLAMASVTGLLLWWPDWDRRRTLIIFAMVIGNLFAVNITTNLSPFGPDRKMILSPEMEALGTAIADSGETSIGLPGRVYNEFRLYDDYGMRQSIEDVWGSSPLKLASYAQLFDEFPLDRMWRLTGVDHVLTWRQELFEPSELLAEFPQAEDTTYLHRLAEPNPRAWLVPQVFYSGDGESDRVATLLADHGYDLEMSAIVTQSDPSQPRIGHGSGIGLTDSVFQPLQAQITLKRSSPHNLQVHVASETGGFLVISENYMPGLQVINQYCDTVQAPCDKLSKSDANPPLFQIQRTNLAFVGLSIPPGPVQFDLVYQPASVRIGAWISGATLVLLIAAGFIMVRKRRSSPR